jgi:hypothetical protein
MGARNKLARNPNTYARRDVVLATLRTMVPVRAAAARSRMGRTMKFRAAKGAEPKIVIAAEASHISPQ